MISYAFSTLDLAEEFNERINALHEKCPLIVARTYLITGKKDPTYGEDIYAEIDAIQAIRKEGISGEMKYARRQAGIYLEMNPGIAGSVEEFLGEDVLSGDDMRLKFPLEMKKIAPNLEVFELFQWYSPKELMELIGKPSTLFPAENVDIW